MKFTVEGKLLFSEYFDTHKKAAHMRRSILRTLVVLGGLFVVFNMLESASGSVLTNWKLYFGIGLIVYGLAVSPLQFKYQVKRNWDRYPAVQKMRKLSFDSTGMTTIDDVGNPAITKWNTFIRWKETKSSFMLYLSPLLWVAVPKRLIGIDHISEFRSYVTTMIDSHNRTNSADA